MSKQDAIAYVADMADQLAALTREHLPSAARLLDVAAEIARDAQESALTTASPESAARPN